MLVTRLLVPRTYLTVVEMVVLTPRLALPLVVPLWPTCLTALPPRKTEPLVIPTRELTLESPLLKFEVEPSTLLNPTPTLSALLVVPLTTLLTPESLLRVLPRDVLVTLTPRLRLCTPLLAPLTAPS